MIRHTAARKCIRYAKTYVHHPSLCRSYYTSSLSLSLSSSMNCKSVSIGSLELQNNTNSLPLSFSGIRSCKSVSINSSTNNPTYHSCNSISLNSGTIRYFSMDPYELNGAYQDSYYGNNYSDLIESIENNEDENNEDYDDDDDFNDERPSMTEEELLQSLSRDEIIDCLDSLGVEVSPKSIRKSKARVLRKRLRASLKQFDTPLTDIYQGYDYDDIYVDDIELEDIYGDDKDYHDMTMHTLKEQLRMHNLKLGGRKDELIERLEMYDAKVRNKNDKDEGEEQEEIEEGEIVSTTEENHRISRESQLDRYSNNYTVAELKEELAKHGLKVGGRKAELVERLVDHLRSSEESFEKFLQRPPPPPPPVNVATVQTPTECVFDTANNYKLTPVQTLEDEDRQHEALLSPALQIPDEVYSLLGLLPPHLRNAKHFQNSSDLIEIVLDLGRRPTCWFAGGSREFLFDDDTTGEDIVEVGDADNTTDGSDTTASTSASFVEHYLVTQDDLNHVLGGLRFGEDNRKVRVSIVLSCYCLCLI